MSKQLITAPTILESVLKGSPVYAEFFSPFGKTQSFAVIGNKNVFGCVARLLSHGRPSAVFFVVVAVIVNAIKCACRGWPKPHIGNEVRKLLPSFADFDTAPRPSCMLRVVGLAATNKHAGPYFIFWRIGHSVRNFRFRKLASGFFSQASARLNDAVSKRSPGGSGYVSAGAFAYPPGKAAPIVFTSGHNNKSPKSLSRNVIKCSHGEHITSNCSHSQKMFVLGAM